MIYSGTESKSSELTKHGKTIFYFLDDGWKSLKRYYYSNNKDQYK